VGANSKKYIEIFEQMAAKFNEIYMNTQNELQTKLDAGSEEIHTLLSEIHRHHVEIISTKAKINAIKAQTAILNSTVQSMELNRCSFVEKE